MNFLSALLLVSTCRRKWNCILDCWALRNKMQLLIKLLAFDNLFSHYELIFAKTRSRMTVMAIAFSRQNDATSRVCSTKHWENLGLVVVHVLESKVLSIHEILMHLLSLDWKDETIQAVLWYNWHGRSRWLWYCSSSSWCSWSHCNDETFDWKQQSVTCFLILPLFIDLSVTPERKEHLCVFKKRKKERNRKKSIRISKGIKKITFQHQTKES